MFSLKNISRLALFYVAIISLGNCDTSCDLKHYRLVSQDQVLSGHVVAAHKVKDAALCMWYCYININCNSFNYQYQGEKEKLCEINNVTLNVCPGKRLQKKGFAYYEKVDDTFNQTYGSEGNPALSCADLQQCGYNISGEYWFMYQHNILKVTCTFETIGFNLALGKPTDQSSTKHSPSRAVDGNRSSNYKDGSCSHTSPHPYDFAPWWRVDLQNLHFVRQVTITNRGDCCYERLSNFEIRVGISIKKNGNSNPVCGRNYSLGMGETRAITCDPPFLGRYVNIVIPGRKEALTLCEVEVYE